MTLAKLVSQYGEAQIITSTLTNIQTMGRQVHRCRFFYKPWSPSLMYVPGLQSQPSDTASLLM